MYYALWTSPLHEFGSACGALDKVSLLCLGYGSMGARFYKNVIDHFDRALYIKLRGDEEDNYA
jgi:hypothetical protein